MSCGGSLRSHTDLIVVRTNLLKLLQKRFCRPDRAGLTIIISTVVVAVVVQRKRETVSHPHPFSCNKEVFFGQIP